MKKSNSKREISKEKMLTGAEYLEPEKLDDQETADLLSEEHKEFAVIKAILAAKALEREESK